MKLFPNFLVGVTTVLLISHSLKAQQVIKRDSSYVVLANGTDTVFCDITSKAFSSKLFYKPLESELKYQAIEPDKIKEYYVKDRGLFYEAVYLPGQKKGFFALVIEKGKINLFEEVKSGTVMSATGGGMSYYNNVTWFISKGSNNVEKLKYNSWIAFQKNKRTSMLEEMIADNKEAAEKYAESKKFTFANIRKIVHFYNTGYWDNN